MEEAVKFAYRVGVYDFHEEPNINYQLNRAVSAGSGRIEDIREIAPRIKTLDDWKTEFMRLANAAMSKGEVSVAATYFRAAEFYMSPEDPEKMIAYDTYCTLFRREYEKDFTEGLIIETKIPYENGFLPAWVLPVKKGKQKKGTIVFNPGLDIFVEEEYPMTNYFRDHGYEVIAFEGPGQGGAERRYGLTMTHEWERPIKALLNHFKLDDVTLIGISLGGYLAPRAAVFDKRIKRVICFGPMYDYFQTVVSRRGKALEVLVKTLLTLRAKPVLNLILKIKMKRDTFIKWGIEHNMYVFGVKTPYDFLKKSRLLTLKNISRLVTPDKDFLILAGAEDHFLSMDQFFNSMKAFANARSITGRIFTRAESAQNHCQFGNIEAALSVMINWIEQSTIVRSGKVR